MDIDDDCVVGGDLVRIDHVVGCDKDGDVVFSGGFGHHTYARGSPHVTTESIYDIASITKVVSITPIVMKLISRKQLRLDQPIYHFIPDFKGEGKEKAPSWC